MIAPRPCQPNPTTHFATIPSVPVPAEVGITIVETATLDEALAWVRKSVKACRMPVEVREIFFVPAPENA